MSTSSQMTMRAFWSELPAEGRLLLSSTAAQTLGRGLTLPFTVIYLNEVRHIPLGTAGTLMAVIAVVALLISPTVGQLIDRLGARAMVIAACAAQLLGAAVLAFASSVPTVMVAMLLLGLSAGIAFPAFNALISAIVTGRLRQQYFGVNFALINLGIGIGGIIAGVFVDVARPATFTAIYLFDAAAMLIPLTLMLGPLRHVHGRASAPAEDTHPASYAAILRQPAVLWLMVLTFLGSFAGYGQMEAGFPAFARQVSEVSTKVIGAAFAVNTLVIVLMQFPVLRWIDGHRRTRVLLAMAALWAASWVLLGATGLVSGSAAAAAGVILFHLLFGLGETMLQPTIPAMVNDSAPDHLRGRYNALSSGAFSAGAILAPVAGGFLLQHRLPVAFITTILVALLLAVLLSQVLERLITPHVNGVDAGHRSTLTPGADPT
ncbi:MAG: MFS transporter [Micrococcales bacterium]|nr:MFS transporter [Micrococcales bacterium]